MSKISSHNTQSDIDGTEDKIKVLIVDSQQLTRELLDSYLKSQNGLSVSSSAKMESGNFDIVLANVAEDRSRWMERAKKAINDGRGASTIIISPSISRETLIEILRLGARGYIPSSVPLRSLLNAIRFVATGEIFTPTNFLIEKDNDISEMGETFSRREASVLRGIITGMTNKEIGRELNLTEATVKMHVRSVCKKLNAKNRTHAAVIANQVKSSLTT